MKSSLSRLAARPSRLYRRGIALKHRQEGRWGYILAWLLGVPIPILVVIYVLRGCT